MLIDTEQLYRKTYINIGAFEVIEPMSIEFWEEIILLHVPEYDFEIDQHIEEYLIKYEIEVHGHDGIGDK